MIVLNKVQKEYGTDSSCVRALCGIDMSVERGEFIAVMGPSGSGKSTLMNILGCLDRAHEGSYHLNGVDTKRLLPRDLAHLRNKAIGFVFQAFHLLPKLTARENIELPLTYAGIPKSKRNHRVCELLELLGLANRANHLPSTLSGGQRQRVAIGRAIANDPPLLLADEPTGSLDSVSGAMILELMQTLNKLGHTIVLITHAMEVAAGAHRILTLRDGRLV